MAFTLPRELDREVERLAFHIDRPKVRIVQDALRAYLAAHPIPEHPVP